LTSYGPIVSGDRGLFSSRGDALIEGQDSLIFCWRVRCRIAAADAERPQGWSFAGADALLNFHMLPIVFVPVWKRWRFLAGFAISV